MSNVVFLSRNRGGFLFELAAQLHVFSIVGTVKATFTDRKFLGAGAPPCANDTAFTKIICHSWSLLPFLPRLYGVRFLFATRKLVDDFIGFDHTEITAGDRFNIFPVME